MKQLIFLLSLISFSISSQDFSQIDKLVSKYPRFTKVEDLASAISKDFANKEHKVRAAFIWLAKNIKYNLDKYYNPTRQSLSYSYSSEEEKTQKLQDIKDKIVAKAFLTKQGVCEEYAQSFSKICTLLGIESEVIKGYVKNDFREIKTMLNSSIPNHAWNAVKLNNKWIILDATWAAGYAYNGKWIREYNDYFYNIPEKNIFKTHFPDKKIWMLRFGRMSLKEFYNQPIYGNSFLNSDAELISPKKGIIPLKLSENIELQFKNLPPNSLIYYTFRSTNSVQKPSIQRANNISTLTIQNPRKSGKLLVFIDGELALQYKVIPQ